MEVLGAVAASVVNCLCTCMSTPVEEQCKHLINPTEEMAVLGSKKTDLIPKVADVKMRLRIAEEQGKTRTDDVKNWLKKVDEFIAEADDLEKKATVPSRCLNGVLPNFCSRMNLAKDITKSIKEGTRLLESADEFAEDNKITFHVPDVGMKMPRTRIIGKTTAEKNLELVWECLMDDETRIIGVYGMGGVGKTTIMKEINNRLLDKKCFDMVIWVTVSKDGNLHKLQYDIAKRVGVNNKLLSEQDETMKSALVLEAWLAKGRIVLILDDIWESFSLPEIGIPDFNEHNGSKLVLTTRSLEVCNRMGCKKNIIKVELLSEDEAWLLFDKTIDVRLDPKVEKMAKDVAKECSCLPLAIVTVGRAMRGEDDIGEWTEALRDLRNSTNRRFNMEEQVIEVLKFSYNRLGDDIYKRCFLYCALWPEDYSMNPEDLIEHWVMEGLVNEKSIKDELHRGHIILKKLLRCCLLESGGFDKGKEIIKMHDLIRDMALDIPKEMYSGIMVKAGARLKDLPDEQAWGEDAEMASFIGSHIKEISISPNCPRLTTLLLNETRSLKRITPSFFVQMPGLRVLNLHGSTIELLPESISDLVNLQVLKLSWCKMLRRVPSVEKLQSLRVLRLDDSGIEELPHGMEALINLRRLSVGQDITHLKTISAFVIPKLCLLQELIFPELRVSVVELLNLSHLESLSVTFKSLSDFCYYCMGSAKFKGLEDFTFKVGYGFRNLSRIRSVTVIRDFRDHIPENALLLPQNTENLEIWWFDQFTRLSDLACLKDVRELRTCKIVSCSALEYILSLEENYPILQHLEKLEISDCPKLITLYKGVVPEPLENLSILPCLMELKIKNCNNLKYLFSSKLLKQLQNLVDVHIDDCKALEELIAEEEEEDMRNEGSKTILLPRLKRLHLRDLPELNSIWKGEMVCDSLQTVEVFNCYKLKRLPQFSGDGQSPPSSLKEIKGSRAWWNTLEWHYPFAKNLFQPLFDGYYYNIGRRRRIYQHC